MPTAVALFVASSYFAGALQKAGEDHLVALKAAALALWRRARAFGAGAPASHDRPRTRHSLTWSIVGETATGACYKLVVAADAGEGDAAAAIEGFLDMARAIQNGTLRPTDRAALESYPVLGGQVVVSYDPALRRIAPVPIAPAALTKEVPQA